MNRFRVTVVLAVSACLFALALPASACSCYRGDPRDRLSEADGAFIGTFVSRRPANEAEPYGEYFYTFQVDEAVKGEFGDTEDVRSSESGAACGLSVSEGQQTGLLLYSTPQGWSSNSCSQMSPPDLRRAATPLPQPDGAGPARLIVGGSFGDARVMPLDKRGRTLGYGFGGNHDVIAQSVCPGGRRLAELYATRQGLRWALRNTSTLKVTSSGEVANMFEYPSAIHCRDRDARKIYALIRAGERPQRIVRLTASGQANIYQGAISEIGFSGDSAYVTRSKGSLGVIDLDSGRRRRIAEIPAPGQPSVSPDGERIAIVSAPYLQGDDKKDSRLFVLDVTAVVAKRSLGDGYVGTGLVWSGDRSIVLICGPNSSIRTYNRDLRELGRTRGSCPTVATTARSALWSIDWEGRLLKVDLPKGTERVVRELPSPTVNAISRMPGEVTVRP